MCTAALCLQQRLTQPRAIKLRPLSLYALFDGRFSGAVETTLTTLDPVHQLDLLELRVESVEVPEHSKQT